MAALRHAARRLCDRALQGAPRIPPGRRPMSMTSNNTNGAKLELYTREELEKQLAESKQAFLENCFQGLSKQPGLTILVGTNTGITPGSVRTTRFSSSAGRCVICGIIARIGFRILPFFLGSVYYKEKFSEPKKREDGATSKNGDAN